MLLVTFSLPYWHVPDLESVRTFSVGSAGVSVLGAVTHNQVMTWTGAGLAVFGATVSAAIAAYHKVREAHRREASADSLRARLDLEAQLRVQIQLEDLVNRNAARAEQLAAALADLEKRKDCLDGAA